MRIILPSLGLLALAAVTSAQDRLVGLTSTTQFLAAPQMDSNCFQFSCRVSVGAVAQRNAGGTAYDGRSGTVWVSNGPTFGSYEAPTGSGTSCVQRCSLMRVPQPTPTSSAYCTGLAFLQSGSLTAGGQPGPDGRLYFLYSNNYVGWADVQGCRLTNYKSCSLVAQIGSANFTGGLAVDVINRRLFVGWYDGSFGGAWSLVCDADNPCQPTCKIQLSINRTACGLGHAPLFSMTGLAFNPCTQTIYATDGKQIIYGPIQINATGCRFTHRSCCTNDLNETYTGLALLPETQRLTSKPCSSRACSNCLPTISTTGDAVLGNAQFAVNLSGAGATTSHAVLAVGLGGCTNGGVSLGHCMPTTISFAAPGPLVFLFGGLGQAGSPCGRRLSLPVPLAVDRSACGFTLSMQWVTICRGTPAGSSMSGCLEVPVSGI